MPEPKDGGWPYQVHGSRVILEAMRQVQRQAATEGRGDEVLAALREIHERLRRDPNTVGEPLYRLPVLRMQVRCVAVRPIAVDYAVCEDQPLVFLKAVRLLANPGR